MINGESAAAILSLEIQAKNPGKAGLLSMVAQTKVYDLLSIKYGLEQNYLNRCILHYKLASEDMDVQVALKAMEQKKR